MSKRVCVVHGVGFYSDLSKADVAAFAKNVSDKTGCEAFVYQWDHPGVGPDDERDTLLFKSFRQWVQEVIMDFTYVAKYIADVPALPDADLYIGHSAGGVIVAAKTTKPQILMGCPAQLLKNMDIRAKSGMVLNVMNYRDPIASKMDGAENIITTDPLVLPWINPFAAHTGYWTSRQVMKLVVERVKRHLV